MLSFITFFLLDDSSLCSCSNQTPPGGTVSLQRKLFSHAFSLQMSLYSSPKIYSFLTCNFCAGKEPDSQPWITKQLPWHFQIWWFSRIAVTLRNATDLLRGKRLCAKRLIWLRLKKYGNYRSWTSARIQIYQSVHLFVESLHLWQIRNWCIILQFDLIYSQNCDHEKPNVYFCWRSLIELVVNMVLERFWLIFGGWGL